MKKRTCAFWKRYPTFSLAISSLLGAFFTAFPMETIPWIVLWTLVVWTSSAQKICNCTIGLAIALYAYALFPEPFDADHARAVFSIEKVTASSSPFKKGWVYTGTIQAIETTNGIRQMCTPCRITYTGEEKTRPKANCSYFVIGSLNKVNSLSSVFKARDWQKIRGTWSFAEWRYELKTKIQRILKENIRHKPSLSFLSTMALAEGESAMLRYEFNRIGLQHLLAVSGFHFATLLGFASCILRPFLPHRFYLLALLFCSSLYFFFLGPTPAITRSWLGTILYIIGALYERKPSGLNLLGACLLIEILISPHCVYQIGFQLSFLACAGIFLFYQQILRNLKGFQRRRMEEIQELSPLSQHSYLLSSFLHKSLSLTLAVNVAILPLQLFYFERIPLFAFLYNLFVPFFSGLALIFLFFSLAIYFVIPGVSKICFYILDCFTTELLEITANPPAILDYAIYCKIPHWMIGIYLSCLAFLVIFLQKKSSELNNMGDETSENSL